MFPRGRLALAELVPPAVASEFVDAFPLFSSISIVTRIIFSSGHNCVSSLKRYRCRRQIGHRDPVGTRGGSRTLNCNRPGHLLSYSSWVEATWQQLERFCPFVHREIASRISEANPSNLISPPVSISTFTLGMATVPTRTGHNASTEWRVSGATSMSRATEPFVAR
jgi:hypothetical protein